MDVNRGEAPLISALDEFLRKDYAYFAIPGHRYDRGMPEALGAKIGYDVYKYDLTEAPGLDDFHDAKGAIAKAQNAAADLFGADECRFSVNGTTALLESAVLACAGPGDEIIIARDAHRSAVSGLILSGAQPVWLLPEMDEKWGISRGIDPESVKECLQQHPDAKAVLIVSPTYYGQASDIAAIADICHENGAALIVDAAHGSHFPFNRAFPTDACSAGADLTAMSLHKTAGSMTQSSILLMRRSGFVSPDKIDAALRMTISSSPSYILMSSLDAARLQLEKNGEEMAEDAITKALSLRRALRQVPGVSVRGGSDLFSAIRENMDITRVVFSMEGISGIDLADRLAKEGNVVIEMADAKNVVAVVTSANTENEIHQLSMAAVMIAGSLQNTGEKQASQTEKIVVLPRMAMLPREAFFEKKEIIPLSEAGERICGEIICPYPPGSALLIPGERISAGVLRRLYEMLRAGIFVQGVSKDLKLSVVAAQIEY